MTHVEELWQSVVAHCRPGEGYRISVYGDRLTLSSTRQIYVEIDATGGWLVVDGSDTVAVRNEADSAVWFAVERMTKK